jgi:hypothetical protein
MANSEAWLATTIYFLPEFCKTGVVRLSFAVKS